MNNITDNELRETRGGEGIFDGIINWVQTTVLGQEPAQEEPTVGDCFNQGDHE